MKNSAAKIEICDKLQQLLNVASNLKVSSRIKLRILKCYIYSQLSFDLRLYEFGVTWVEQNLVQMCTNSVRIWLDMPVSSCIAEFMALPKKKAGLGIPTLANVYSKQWLSKRYKMKTNDQEEIRHLWNVSSGKHVETDAILIESHDFKQASTKLKAKQQETITEHIDSLESQGIVARSVRESIPTKNITAWSTHTEKLPDHLFRFSRRALQQQLPTAANLTRWSCSTDPMCSLCKAGKKQSNKHVLSNCSSPIALQRYTDRHNAVLETIVGWLASVLPPDRRLLADLDGGKYGSVEEVFSKDRRPDIVILDKEPKIVVLELTVCHETNLENSKEYKLNKYRDLSKFIQPNFRGHQLETFTIEVSVLGFVSSLSSFSKAVSIPSMSNNLLKSIIYEAINHSYNIYRNRNSAQ